MSIKPKRGYGPVNEKRLRDVFQKKAEHHLSLMNDAGLAGQTSVFMAHQHIADGYFRAARRLGCPPSTRRHKKAVAAGVEADG